MRPRVLVVGASAGIGRETARHAAATGAQVCVAARRVDRLREIEDVHPIMADVTKPDDCARLVTEAADHLGGLDLLVHAAGFGELSLIENASSTGWQQMWEVNVVGPTLVTAAALSRMSTDGVVAFLSSETTHEPRWGLAGYTATKAALDATIRSWRVEHPERRFVRVVVGAVSGTEFGSAFGMEVLTTALDRWHKMGISPASITADALGNQLADVFSVMLAHPEVDVPDVVIDPRGEPWKHA